MSEQQNETVQKNYGARSESHGQWTSEEDFKLKYPIVWWVTLVGPLFSSLAILLLVAIIYGWSSAANLAITAVLTFFLLGKFVILGGRIETGSEWAKFYSPEQLAGMVLYLDVMTVCVLVFHLGFLFKLPMLGKKLEVLVANGHALLEATPWMKRATFLGLILFVMTPLASTGSVGGSILGRLLGMSRLGTFIGVVLGNILGIFAMYFGGELFMKFVGSDNPLVAIIGVGILIGALYFLNRRYQAIVKKQRSA